MGHVTDLSALYRAVVETSPDGIWVLDLDGRTIYANPEIARIHRIPEDQLAALNVADTLDEAGRKQFTAHLDDIRHGIVNTESVDVQWVRADGSIVWMLVTETRLFDEHGEACALLHRFTDYTDRRALRESLRASEDALADQVAQNVLMQAVTSAANEASTLAEVLTQARDLVLLHDDWERARAFVPDDHGLLVRAPFDDGGDIDDVDDVDDGAVAKAELDLARRCFASASLVWDERRLTVAFPVVLDDAVHAVVAITSKPPLWRFEMIESMAMRVGEQFARVVRRQQSENELAQSRDQALAASRHKSDFLATMSHEIRTPLNGVIGLNEVLLSTDLDPDQHRLASGVQVASRALLEVINEILDFSKIEAGRLELEQVDFAIRPLLDQVAGLLAETARGKGLDLTVSCAAEVPAVLHGDPTRLAQVVTNLVSNAVKFTDTGRVAVTVGVMTEGDRSDTGRLRLEVRDTGIGIPADRVAGLFEPFTQADTSTTRKYGGTGLGLAICSAIVEAMHGTVGYQANPAGGSAFWADLPLTPGAEAASGTAADDGAQRPTAPTDEDDAARHRLGGLRVLLIDSRDGDVLSDQLAYWGLVVEPVTSVRAALARLQEPGAPGIDVVLIALAGAEWRVLELCEAMRGGHSDTVPLVVVASSTPDDPARLRAAGVSQVLVRPVLPSLLRTTMIRFAAGEPDPGTAPTIHPTGARGRILVVDDHPANQMVAEGLLRLRGYLCEVVGDGIAAVEAVARGGFDAVLMDVQMPRLDGYGATRQIRDAEVDGRRVPVIAMTAAAVDGERERCLAAGMDDFLTKPITGQVLDACLDRWVRPGSSRAVTAPLTTTDPPLDALDEEPIILDLDRLEELRELDTPSASYVDRAVGNLLAGSVRDVAVMHAALDGGDLTVLASVAHRLAGGALNLGAARAGAALRTIEDRVRAGDHEGLAVLLASAEQELTHARAALEGYLSWCSAAQVAVDAGAQHPEDHADDGAPRQRLQHQ